MVHADAVSHSLRIAASIRAAREAGILTDAMVSAATTNQGLRDAITAATGHADLGSIRDRVNDAIQYGKESGELSDANVLAATTIVLLLANLQDGGTNRIEQMP